MKKVTAKDIFGLNFVGNPLISPDGKKILFTVWKADEKKNDYTSLFFLYDGERIKQFTQGKKDGGARWSPSGNKIAFLSKRSEGKGNDIMIIDVNGGEARAVAHFDNGAEHVEWLDEKNLVVKVIEKEKKDPKDDVHIIDKIPFWFNGQGFTYSTSSQLYLVSLRGRKKKLTNEVGAIETFKISPNGEKIAFIETIDLEKKPLVSDIFVLNVKNGKTVKLTNSKMSISDLVWSEDSERIAFSASDLKHGSFTNPRIYIMKAKARSRMKKVCDTDRSKWNSVNSDSRMGASTTMYWSGEWVYFLMTDGPSAKIYRAKEGRVEEVIGGEGRTVDSFSVSKNGVVAFTAMSPTSLDELYLFRKGKERKLTHLNATFLKRFFLSKPEYFEVTSSDGKKIDAWIMKPADFDEKKKYPAVLEIHGGPRTAYGYGFFLEFQILTSHGYAVIFSNPRGSDGYGEEFSDIFGAYGKRDYKDIMEVMDEALRKFSFIDKEKLGVTGGSYGGYMTNWIVGHTDRFKAAVSQRSISNWVSFFGTTDIGYFFGPDQLGGDPWSNFEGYREMSPLTYAPNVKTPLLLIHSMEDKRCWMAEAFQFFTALKYFGKEVELALFPDETHELSRSGKPLHRVRRLELILDWFESHLKERKN